MLEGIVYLKFNTVGKSHVSLEIEGENLLCEIKVLEKVKAWFPLGWYAFLHSFNFSWNIRVQLFKNVGSSYITKCVDYG